MADLVTTPTLIHGVAEQGVVFAGPRLVASAVETDLSTPDTSVSFDTRGVSLMAVQVVFANYTGVTVKAQRSLDGGTTYNDITDATTSTSGTVFSFDPQAPLTRLSIAATLSVGSDSLSVYAYVEYMR